MPDTNIRAVITAEDRASATLKKVQGQIEAVGGSASKFLGDAMGQASLAAAAGLGVLSAVAISSVKAFEESQTTLTQLDAVLKSTGGSAGVTRDEAIKLSQEIQKTTSFSDEAALAVENMGLTFTAIHKDIFPQFTKAALDTATALNHGLKPSTEQVVDVTKMLGKAMQDPDAGLGALHRYGVNVDELKKKFVGVTDVATKQKLIIAELGTEFGGSASAQAKTFAGRLDHLKNIVNDVQEKIGETITKALIPFAEKALAFINAINWDSVINNTIRSLTNFKDKFMEFTAPIREFLEKHKQILLDFMQKFGESGLIVIPILAALALAVTTLTSPLFLIITALTIGWELWEKHRVLFLALTVVIAPVTLAFIALRAAMLFSEVVTALNTSIVVLTGTDIAATAAANGLAASLWAVLAAAAGPVTLVVIGVAAIWGAVQAVNALNDAWTGAANAAAQSNALDNKAIKAIENNPNLTKQQKHDRLLGLLDPQYRAEGGPVQAGQAYIVGEKRPELFIPNQSGTIVPRVPNNSTPISISINAGAFMGNPSDARQYAKLIIEHMKDIAGAKNMTAAELLS